MSPKEVITEIENNGYEFGNVIYIGNNHYGNKGISFDDLMNGDADKTALLEDIKADDDAMISYTSGTTNDVFSVYEAAGKLVEHIRAGNGPAFLECKTYRVKRHYMGDPEKYRTREEVQKNIEERDPIEAFKKRVLAEKVYTADDLKSMEEKVDGLIARHELKHWLE